MLSVTIQSSMGPAVTSRIGISSRVCVGACVATARHGVCAGGQSSRSRGTPWEGDELSQIATETCDSRVRRVNSRQHSVRTWFALREQHGKTHCGLGLIESGRMRSGSCWSFQDLRSRPVWSTPPPPANPPSPKHPPQAQPWHQPNFSHCKICTIDSVTADTQNPSVSKTHGQNCSRR